MASTLEQVTLAVLEDAEEPLLLDTISRAVARRMKRRDPGWRESPSEVESALKHLRRLGSAEKDGARWRRA
jgi:hypothetical protein